MKIQHEFNSITNPYLSCTQIAFATYARNNNRHYEMILSETWGFDFHDNEKIFGKSLHPGYQGRRRELLEKYHGIRVTDLPYESKKELCSNIFSYINKYGPMLLKCDIYNCSWNMAYRHDHVNHFIIIIGANDQNSIVTILDPFTSENKYEVDLNDVANENGILCYFEMIGQESISDIDIRTELNHTLEYIRSIDMFDKMGLFSKSIPQKFEFDDVSIKNVYAVPLVFNLYRIMNQRYCFSLFLRVACDYKIIDESFVAEMKTIADKYKLLRIIVVKTILQQKSTEMIVDIINDIISKERKLYKKLVDVLKNEEN